MLAVKGTCHVCRQVLSIMEPGIVCFNCEKFHHGGCVDPPQDLRGLQNLVLRRAGWICKRCSQKPKVQQIIRTDAEMKEIGKKLDTLMDVRSFLLMIEDALTKMTEKCQELSDNAVATKAENQRMRKRIALHEKLADKKPKTFQEWRRKRKQLGVDEHVKKLRFKKFDAKSAFRKKKSFEAHVRKTHGIKKKPKPKRKSKAFKFSDLKSPRKIGGHLKGAKNYIKAKTSSAAERSAVLAQKAMSNMSKGWWLQLTLCLLMLFYTLIGGLILMIVEGTYENGLAKEILAQRERVLQNYTYETLANYYDYLVEMFNLNSDLLVRGDDRLNWNFIGAVFFCGTTYSTIGFGDISPVTRFGKIFTILYALVGIPLFLILLASLGRTMLRIMSLDLMLWNKCLVFLDIRKPSADEIEPEEEENRMPLWYFVCFLVAYFFLGAVIFLFLEDWSFLDSLYFMFVTVLTIGFGDFVPGNRFAMIICLLYAILGLTISTMTIAAVVV